MKASLLIVQRDRLTDEGDGHAVMVSLAADEPSDVMVQGFITPQGKKVLLVNKANSDKTVVLATDLQNASTLTVDEETADGEPRAGKPDGANLKLAPYGVTVLTVP